MSEPLFSLLVAAILVGFGWLFFGPQRRLFRRWYGSREKTERVRIEDTLKYVQESELDSRCPTVQSVAGALGVSVEETADLLSKMEAQKLLQAKDDGFCLTPTGRDYALQIIRAHRLWERHLADETGFGEDEWHDQAHRREHMLTSTELDTLSRQLSNPTHDPHGDPIPTANGRLVPLGGRPVTTLELDEPARIVHLEDEPPSAYAQLVAEGLWPGMQLRVTEMSPQRVRFWAEGDEHVLTPDVANNITVVPLSPSEESSEAVPTTRLADLKPGESAQVVGISRACRGIERRRLLDLGVLPGTHIEAEMTSPSGDPTAYRIRGAVIALRHEQANHIYIKYHEELA